MSGEQYELYQQGTAQALADHHEATYSKQDGYYEQLTAGAADNLTGRGDGVGAEYIYRTSGGTADVADGTARINVIKGNTVAWNQLVENQFDSDLHWPTWTMTDTSYTNNVFTGTLTNGYGGVNIESSKRAALTQGHKYLMLFDVKSPDLSALQFGCGAHTQRSFISTEWAKYSLMFTAESGDTMHPMIQGTGYLGTFSARYPMFFDLTAMFGAGNEPATVAEFEALYPEAYYAYDAGTLLPVNMEGVETVGFNQWDEQWVNGYYDQNGAFVSNNNYIASKNKTPIFPSTTYNLTSLSGFIGRICFYDVDESFISSLIYVTGDTTANYAFTTPANAYYIAFDMRNGYGTTYKNDICINLSWSGYRKGEYEPYWEFEREIPVETYFPNGMRSAGTVYDELQADKAIQRVGAVDMGTLTWAYDSAGDFFGTQIADKVSAYNLECAIYNIGTGPVADFPNMTMRGDASKFLYVKNTSYNDADLFKAAMSGVMLYYELKEPTVTTIDPPLNFSYKVSDFGTERVMVPTGEMTAPVPMQIVYGLNAVDTIRRLPVEYISHASMAQFIAAIEQHFNVTITETYDEDEERYEYSIAANESAGD